MKKLLLIAFVLTVFVLGANAQVPTPFSFYAGGAVSVPSSPDGFKDGFKTGYHGMIGAGYKALPMLQVVGKVEYHNFGFDFGDLSGIDGGNSKVWMFGADGRYNFNLPAAPVAPFVFGGLGMANVKQSEFSGTSLITSTLNATVPEDQNKMYWNIGAGFDWKVSPTIKLFLQGRYVNVNMDGDAMTFIPVTVGLRFF